LSGRGLCDELITRPEESYRLCCVVVCDLETSRICAPYIYDISNLKVKFKPRPSYFRKRLRYPLYKRMFGPRGGHDILEKEGIY
jgi:hypothetical protein